MKDLGNILPPGASGWTGGTSPSMDGLSEMHSGRLGYCPNPENLQERLRSAVCVTKDGLKKGISEGMYVCIMGCVVGHMSRRTHNTPPIDAARVSVARLIELLDSFNSALHHPSLPALDSL